MHSHLSSPVLLYDVEEHKFHLLIFLTETHFIVSSNTLQTAIVLSFDPVANRPGLESLFPESSNDGAKSTAYTLSL